MFAIPEHDVCPPVATRGISTWHADELLPSFEKVAVTTSDVQSHSGWVHRFLQTSELLEAFEVPHLTQAEFSKAGQALTVAPLPFSTPVGVLRLLISSLLPQRRSPDDVFG
jgi:hypothetical protein